MASTSWTSQTTSRGLARSISPGVTLVTSACGEGQRESATPFFEPPRHRANPSRLDVRASPRSRR
eukprot:scaffold140111_cov166-Phaeocystis_antarctica.AAC.1